MTELENKVLNIINCVTDSKYISTFKVEKDEDTYILKLDLTQYLAPLVLSFEGDEEGFLKFIYDEFKNRKIERTHWYKAIREEDPIYSNWLI